MAGSRWSTRARTALGCAVLFSSFVGSSRAEDPKPPLDPVTALQQIRQAIAAGGKGSTTLTVDAPGGPAPSRAKSKSVAKKKAEAAEHGVEKSHAAGHAVHWSYEGEGAPDKWSTLEPGFSVCAIGKRQSPVHIQDQEAVGLDLEPITFEYQASSGSIFNNGHTVQVDLDEGNSIMARGTRYKLVQFHFHHPAEERINHQGFPMVAHLVHKAEDGRLAVVAVLFQSGDESALVNRLWSRMPMEPKDRVPLEPFSVDPTQLLPKDRRHYQFMGSLTTPPCTEGVLWLVLKTPSSLSAAQIAAFSRLYPNNARPVQPLYGRLVQEAR